MLNVNKSKEIKINIDNVDNLPTYVLSFGINLFFFLLLFIPSLTKYWALLLFSFDLLYLFTIKDSLNKKIYLNITPTMGLWTVFTVISFGSLTMTGTNFFEGLRFVFTLALCLLNFILLISNDRWLEITLKMLTVTSLFFLLGSVIQLFAPDLILGFNRLHLSDVLFEKSLEFYRNGALNGLTYQTGVNGFILSILMGINLGYIYKTDSLLTKFLLWGSYFIVFYLLILTRKRGFILFNVLLLCFIIYRLSKKKVVAFIIVLIISLLILLMVFTTEGGLQLVQRTLNQKDFTTGRSAMIEIMWNDFLENPIIGNGTYTTVDVVKYHHGHNIYFQVLRENGILGFLSLIGGLLIGFIKTNIKLIQYENNQSKKYILIISLYFQSLFILWGATGNPLYDTYPIFFYFIAIAMSETLENQNYNIYGSNEEGDNLWLTRGH